MDSFPEIVNPLWDLSNPDNLIPIQTHFQDQDLFALFNQKPYPPILGNSVATDSYPTYPAGGVDPQNVGSYALPSLTPPSATSEDSSPSPPSMHTADTPEQEASGSQDSALKRKADDDEHDEEPSHKSQHTTPSADKRNGTSRRKSGNKDETRLLKRKEQNRAAQRAFRERKEKHVKDLEDKVAELEAKNEQAQNENENLRDLLTRLQNENLTLKQSPFSFTMPKDGAAPSSSDFSSAPTPSSSSTGPTSPKVTNPLDWSSLTTFDPNVLNLLDDNVSQPTATDGAMQMNFGFGGSNAPFTTLATNPMFMSFASSFDSPNDGTNSNANSNANGSVGNNNFNFDMSSLTSWNNTSPNATTQDPLFDDLFSGYMNAMGSVNAAGSASSTSISPVTHHTSPSALANRSPSASTSSPSVLAVADPISNNSPSGSTSISSPDSSSDTNGADCDGSKCPKTRAACVEAIENSGPSVFAPPIQKSQDNLGTMIKCTGSKFPKTSKSDQNVEVLAAWRSIRADPKFKDVDINDLCSQFTSKARCDGTKVVLEPAGVSEILADIGKTKSTQQ